MKRNKPVGFINFKLTDLCPVSGGTTRFGLAIMRDAGGVWGKNHCKNLIPANMSPFTAASVEGGASVRKFHTGHKTQWL